MSTYTPRPRILVVCPTAWERTAIASPELASQYEFFSCCEELYDAAGFLNALYFDVNRYLDAVVARYRDVGIAGVLGTGDYPGCMFGAFIAQKLGLASSGLRETVLLSHKYHSRQIQKRFAPDATPHFEVLTSLLPRKPKTLDYPFFVKPVKGTMSIRAQMVRDQKDLMRALFLSPRDHLRSFVILRPFAQLLKQHEPEPVSARSFIAEAPLFGEQVTVDGFVQNGRATVMGITDSIMYPGTMSFRRFEYPSSLPDAVQARMADIAVRVMEGAGFDHSCFNMELFYDAARDAVSIIEINPRMSYQFSDLYERVDGMSSFAVQLGLATGKVISWPRGAGADRAAASFVMRRFRNARVLDVPKRYHLEEIEKRFPGTQVKVLCEVGERLSDHDQDVGSYRYCIVNMAAPSRNELHERFSVAESLLPFSFADL